MNRKEGHMLTVLVSKELASDLKKVAEKTSRSVSNVVTVVLTETLKDTSNGVWQHLGAMYSGKRKNS